MESFPRVIAATAVVILLLCEAGAAQCAPEPSKTLSPSTAQLERCVRAKAEQEAFSGVVSIQDHGQPVVSLMRGVLAGPGSTPIGVESRFNLGSMSKMFTAVAIGQLVDAGKISFDDRVGKYVTGLTPEASTVTVRQLLTHSAGLGDFFQPQNMEAMLKARTSSDLLPLIAGDKPSFAPGSKFQYSNSGFALLGILIERVSGQTYGQYLQAHVFSPARMVDTGLSPQPLATLAVGMTAMGEGISAQPHAPGNGRSDASAHSPGDGTGKQLLGPSDHAPGPALMLIGPDGKRIEPPSRQVAEADLKPAPGATEGYGSSAGGLFSTAEDMQRFATALVSNQLLTEQSTKVMTSPQIIAIPAANGKPAHSYGMGFGVGVDSGGTWYGHNGGTAGSNAEFAVFPDKQVTITVLSNRDPPVASTLFRYAKDLLFNPAKLQACGSQP